MNLQQFREQARTWQPECCRACGRFFATQQFWYVHEDATATPFPLCNRCAELAIGQHLENEDAIDEMVRALVDRQWKLIQRLNRQRRPLTWIE